MIYHGDPYREQPEEQAALPSKGVIITKSEAHARPQLSAREDSRKSLRNAQSNLSAVSLANFNMLADTAVSLDASCSAAASH